jgi:hypothetical protein
MKRAIRWPSASIHTAASLQRSNRQLSRRSAGAAQVLSAMKRGATLHLHYQDGRPIWRLSTGPFVTSEAAAIVTASNVVVGVGDSLFPNHPGQTWRYVQ